MANVARFRRADAKRVRMYPVASATVIEMGDNLYYDNATDGVKPAGSLTYSSLAATQANFAARYVGVALDLSANGDTDKIAVASRGVFEFPCAAATFNVGDLVGQDDNSGGSALEDAQVIGMGENGITGIGRAARYYSANTTSVLVEIMPYIESNSTPQVVSLYQGLITSAADLVTAWVPPYPFKLVKMQSVVTVLTAGAGVINFEHGTTDLTETIAVAGSSAVGAFDSAAVTTANEGFYYMGDTLSVESNGNPSAGQCLVQMVIVPLTNET